MKKRKILRNNKSYTKINQKQKAKLTMCLTEFCCSGPTPTKTETGDWSDREEIEIAPTAVENLMLFENLAG